MIDTTKFVKRHSFYDEAVNKRKYSVTIPSRDSKKSRLSSYYTEVREMTDEFYQRNTTRDDKYLIHEALGIPNSQHHYVQDFNDE